MDNLKRSAYPLPICQLKGGEITATMDYCPDNGGFTKLEKAALIIAQGLVAKYNMKEPGDQKIIAQMSVELATEVINEANR